MRIVFKMADNEGAGKEIISKKAGRFRHVNAVRNLFWDETHSGIQLIPVSCE